MGRIKRADAAGAIYHMLNRGNRRATIFEKEADYEVFGETEKVAGTFLVAFWLIRSAW